MGTSLQEVAWGALGVRAEGGVRDGAQVGHMSLTRNPVGPGGSEEGMTLEPEPHWLERGGEFPPGSCLQVSL